MERDRRSSSRRNSTRALGQLAETRLLAWKKKASLWAAGGAEPWMQAPASKDRRRVAAGTRRRRASRSTKRRRRLWTVLLGSGMGGNSFTVHPFGPWEPFDEICAVRIGRSRGHLRSAWRQDSGGAPRRPRCSRTPAVPPLHSSTDARAGQRTTANATSKDLRPRMLILCSIVILNCVVDAGMLRRSEAARH